MAATEVLFHQNFTRREQAAKVLGGQAPEDARRAVPAMIKALDYPDLQLRDHMVCLLGKLPLAKEAVPRMLEILKDSNGYEPTRRLVAINLANIGHCEEQAAPILLKMLESNSPTLRHGAASALGKLGRKHDKVVPALIKALNDPDERVVSGAAGSLGLLGKDPRVCVPALVETLRSFKRYDGNNDPRPCLLGVLGRFGENAIEAVPWICEIAEDRTRNHSLRMFAVRSLGEIGPAAQAAVATLKTIAKLDENAGLTEDAVKALTIITGSDR